MTAIFQFRLEKVWQHRRRVVDEHSLVVARADREVASLSRSKIELGEKIARHSRTMVPREGHTVQPRDLIDGATWQDHLYRLQEDLDSQLQAAVRDLERCRSELTEVWRDLEVLTRLKERQMDNWRVGQDKRERSEMDEIGQIRAFRHGVNKVSR